MNESYPKYAYCPKIDNKLKDIRDKMCLLNRHSEEYKKFMLKRMRLYTAMLDGWKIIK